MEAKPIALQLYSLREEAKKDFVGVLKTVASFGYMGVETAGLHDLKPAELRKVLDELGLKCCSMHVGFPTKDNVNELADTAKALGTNMLISGLGPKDFATKEARDAGFARIKEAAGLAKSKGMKYGYHNHWWEFDKLDGQYGYDAMMAAVPNMFSELDVYWASNFGAVDVPAVVQKYAKRIPLLHIKDGPLVKDQPHTAVGSGKLAMPPIVQAADPKVLKWLVVELDACATDMTKAVEESVRYLKSSGLGKAS